MEDEKFKDLLEDEELTTLRLAALASKRKKYSSNNTNDSVALPINSIVTSSASVTETASNQIPFVQSERNAFNNNYSWRKQNQASRRRGGPFLKNNQRSNLIVISPVALNEDKAAEGKAPALILPQHRWCNSGNEESMSPKTLRRTGPTRFNRHGSDSESSESDYEKDNDSGSNETVLQDEPPEHFSRLSPNNDAASENVEKKRRLSFQNLDSEMKSDTFDKSETTTIYNLLKNPYDSANNMSDSYTSVQNTNDDRHSWNNSIENEYKSYKQYNSDHGYISEPLDSSKTFARKQINSSVAVVSNGESHFETNNFAPQSSDVTAWPHLEVKSANSYYSREASSVATSDRQSKNYPEKRRMSNEIQSSSSAVWQHEEGVNKSSFLRKGAYDHKSYKDDKGKTNFLSEGDLRFELKKRMQEIDPDPIKSHNGKIESNVCERNSLENSYTENVNNDLSYGNKQEYSNFRKNGNGRSFSQEKDERSLNHKRYRRSLSAERNRQGSSSGKEINRFGYSSGPEKSKYDHSPNQSRSRSERSSSRGRSRHDRSSSRGRNRRDHSSGRSRQDRSSSRDKWRNDQSRLKQEISQNPNKREDSCSPRRKKLDCNVSEERGRYSLNKGEGYHERRISQDKSRNEYNTSQNRRSERSSSRGRSRRRYSSSSDSRHERSSSQDRNSLHSHRSGSRRKRSTSHERCKYERSSSRSRSRSSESQDSKHERSQSYDRRKHDSSSQESYDEHSSNQGKGRHKNDSESISSRSKHASKQHRSRYTTTSHHNKIYVDSVLNQDTSKEFVQIEKLEDSQKSEKVKEIIKFEKNDIKEESEKLSRSKHNADELKMRESKISHQKHRMANSAYRSYYSRSRSNSSTSSSSSSSSHGSRPKIRSVSSVIKSVPPKKIDFQEKETFHENKSFGKNTNLNSSQLDASSSNKKNIDGDHNKLSTIKSSRVDVDFKACDNGKRVPVHMRLGVLPRKLVIQMPKDVEAAFVNSSSSSDEENVNSKCKRQNIRIVTDVFDANSSLDYEKNYSAKEKSPKRPSDLHQEKSKRLKIKR